jgi:hypothetical protein
LKYSGLDVNEAKRLGMLGVENIKQKQLLVEAMLDIIALKNTIAKMRQNQELNILLVVFVTPYLISKKGVRLIRNAPIRFIGK